ncbi:MAG: PKD domain-containing protein [Bacteroidota bacterium]
MKALILLFAFFLLFIGDAMAVRPTQQPTNFTITNTTCKTLVLKWLNGNGKGRIIIAREGGPTTYTPVDGTIYKSNIAFGMSTAYNTDNFIIYNDTAVDSVSVATLKMGKTYYFTIYEHDNAGSNILYNTTNPPSVSNTTFLVTLKPTVIAVDSCLSSNSYAFNYTASSTAPSTTYQWNFGDDNTSNSNPAIHSFAASGYYMATLKATSSINDCGISAQRIVYVYQDKNASLTFPDTVGCFTTNLFTGYANLFPNNLNCTYRLLWDFGDSTFSNDTAVKKIYEKSGLYNVILHINSFSYKGDSLGCDEKLTAKFRVLNNHLSNINIPDRQQTLTDNLFIFENNDSSLTEPLWEFGDFMYANTWQTTHSYLEPGNYIVKHSVFDATHECFDRDTFHIAVLEDPSTTIKKKILSADFKLFPNPANQLLTVQSTQNNQLQTLRILDINGRVIKEILCDNKTSELQLNTGDITTGVYLLEIQTESGSSRQLFQIYH